MTAPCASVTVRNLTLKAGIAWMSIRDDDVATTVAELARGRHRVRVVLLGTTATVTVALVVGVAALIALPDRGHREPAGVATAPPDTRSAAVPGMPAFTVTPPDGSGSCTASWTVDDGGSAITRYYVSWESIPRTPGGDAVETRSSQIAKTTDTSQQVPSGSLVTVTAENGVGKGSTSDKVACGK